MGIKNIVLDVTGLVGVNPRIVYIETDDTFAAVTTTGYLNHAVQQGNSFNEADMALVTTKTTPAATVVSVSWLDISHVGTNWSLIPTAGAGSVTLPTIASHIATYTNVTGGLSEDAATAINGGNIQAGLSGTAGYVASFPATAARGSLRFVAANSAGDTVTQITNASQAAARVYTIPDAGAASNFLMTNNAGTQTIATGSLALTVGNITATAGNVTAGSSGAAGTVTSFPATAANGSLILSALNAGANFTTTIRNSVMGQSTVYSIPDVGAATGSFLVNVLANTDPNANLVAFDVTVGFGALAAAGIVTLQASSGAKQYKIRQLFLNSNGTNFSGGGGDRLATISDGTTAYTVIPAATLQALINIGWGGAAGLPFPAAAAINTSTVAGQSIRIAYSGGTTDYTAGSMVISGICQRIA